MNDHIISLVVLALVIILGVLFTLRSGAKRKAVLKKLQEGATVLDVRTASEYQAAHYPGAKNIPVQNLSAKLDKVGPKNKPVVVYCASGARAASAAAMLRSSGFTDVINAGGLAGMPKTEVV